MFTFTVTFTLNNNSKYRLINTILNDFYTIILSQNRQFRINFEKELLLTFLLYTHF